VAAAAERYGFGQVLCVRHAGGEQLADFAMYKADRERAGHSRRLDRRLKCRKGQFISGEHANVSPVGGRDTAWTINIHAPDACFRRQYNGKSAPSLGRRSYPGDRSTVV